MIRCSVATVKPDPGKVIIRFRYHSYSSKDNPGKPTFGVISNFAVVAIYLSCLGLYGLATFMAVQRIKEVGIRKVFGATSASIIYLFSTEFIVLITIAFAIATPIAWYFMRKWLQGYAYRINISWWLFALGGLAAIIIALITVSVQTLKAATANPANSFRSE